MPVVNRSESSTPKQQKRCSDSAPMTPPAPKKQKQTAGVPLKQLPAEKPLNDVMVPPVESETNSNLSLSIIDIKFSIDAAFFELIDRIMDDTAMRRAWASKHEKVSSDDLWNHIKENTTRNEIKSSKYHFPEEICLAFGIRSDYLKLVKRGEHEKALQFFDDKRWFDNNNNYH